MKATTAQHNDTRTLQLLDVMNALRRPEVAEPLARATGLDNLQEQFQRDLYELNSLVLQLRRTAFGLNVLGEGLATGLDLKEPQAEGVQALIHNMAEPLQTMCEKINRITGYQDY